MLGRLRLTLLVVCITVPGAMAQPRLLQGRVSVIDGDTLDMRGQRLRLSGLDAFESSQMCVDDLKLRYNCGRRATLFLSDLIGWRVVTCVDSGARSYKRIVVKCSVGQGSAAVDLSAAMISAGWAVASSKRNSSLRALEAQARANKRGAWAGAFELPAIYRQKIYQRR